MSVRAGGVAVAGPVALYWHPEHGWARVRVPSRTEARRRYARGGWRFHELVVD